MAKQTLTGEQIASLLAKEPAKKLQWPDPDDVVRLAKAVRDNRETVTFGNGKMFLIRYSDRWGAAYIKPANGEYTPCGYFNYDRLRGVLKHGVDA